MRYRLGLDVGTNSLGWWMWEEDAEGHVIRAVDGGVRIFGDGRNPKDKSSLATKRRVPRGMRRRRDRYLKRRARLMDDLVRCGLMPMDDADRKKLEKLDPYALRVKALDGALPPHQLGRALFHLNQRRGFKSNRKAGGDEKEDGVIRKGISKLDEAMESEGARTLGEYLYRRRKRREGTRARPSAGFYADRQRYLDEFDKIQKAQKPHQALEDEEWDRLEDTIFFQRNLKPVDPGRCTFFPEEKRAPIALPLSQRFRILQEVANLEIIAPGERDRRLTTNERGIVVKRLLSHKNVSFSALHKALELDPSQRFNLESEKRKALKGDETATILSHRDRFGSNWRTFALERQTEIVKYLLDTESEDAVLARAMSDWGLSETRAQAVARARLPASHTRLSEKAMGPIVNELNGGLRYHEALQKAFPDKHHSDLEHKGDAVAYLPYYPEILERHVAGGRKPDSTDIFERIGRISNPTVHIGLNQIRRLINAIIKKHGRPAKIVVELARDLKNSVEKRREIEERQRKEREKNEDRKKKIEDCGVQWTPALLRRLRLWEEQGKPHERHCPYCFRSIGFRMIIDSEVDEDHILPFRRTLDDSMANRVICCRRCNQEKRNRSPAEAFDGNPRYDFAKIMYRADDLPKNKRWRFQPNAMERFENQERDFLDRQLNETRYLSRITRFYLRTLCENVYVTPGTLTGLLRGKWGLNHVLSDSNLKNRTDHRHHAIDAAVIGLTDRSMLQSVASASAKGVEGGRLIEDMPQPPSCPNFRQQIVDRVADMVVWHKPDHVRPGKIEGTSDSLHNDTAYGIVSGPDENGYFVLVRRKTIGDLKNEAGLKRIVDERLRDSLSKCWKEMRKANAECKWNEFAEAVRQPGTVTRDGVRHVRVHERMSGVIQIRDQSNRAYKAYKADANAFMDIFKLPNGRWSGETVRVFDANQSDFVSGRQTKHRDAEFLMRLHIDDLIAVGKGKTRRVLRVVQLSGQKILCADSYEGGSLKKRHNDPSDPFRWFQKNANTMRQERLRRLGVDELGKVRDAGPIA